MPLATLQARRAVGVGERPGELGGPMLGGVALGQVPAHIPALVRVRIAGPGLLPKTRRTPAASAFEPSRTSRSPPQRRGPGD